MLHCVIILNIFVTRNYTESIKNSNYYLCKKFTKSENTCCSFLNRHWTEVAVFWIVMSSTLLEGYRPQSFCRTFLWNVGKRIWDYTKRTLVVDTAARTGNISWHCIRSAHVYKQRCISNKRAHMHEYISFILLFFVDKTWFWAQVQCNLKDEVFETLCFVDNSRGWTESRNKYI